MVKIDKYDDGQVRCVTISMLNDPVHELFESVSGWLLSHPEVYDESASNVADLRIERSPDKGYSVIIVFSPKEGS